MKNVAQIALSLGILSGWIALGVSCGSGDESPSEETTVSVGNRLKSSQQIRVEALARAVGAPGEEGQAAMGDLMRDALAASKEEVTLPSHRRLKAFLPASLPDLPGTRFESEHQPGSGRSVASARYQPSAFDHENRVKLEISYYGKQMFNGPERLFGMGFVEPVEIAGFEALVDEDESMGKTRFEVMVRLSPELWVEASGTVPYEQVRDVVLAIDLAALAEQLANGQLFEDSGEDLLERRILSEDALEALLPASLGALEQRGSNASSMLENDPLHCRATGQYGTGSLILFDYGDADVAQAIALGARGLRGFMMYAAGNAEAVQEEPLEIAGGHGSWVWLRQEAPRPSAVGLHLARGRFVLEYAGPFVPAPEEIDSSAPEEYRRQILQIQRDMGAGAFDSIEAQRDAVVAFFEALDLDAFDN